MLAVRGRVLPSTLENVTLCAELVDGTIVRGESTISAQQTADQARLSRSREARWATSRHSGRSSTPILIVLGPGSLYTSVLPNLMVDGVIEAIRWSRGPVVYVCNVATQPGETDHFGAKDHIQTVMDALGPGVLSYALVNSNLAPTRRSSRNGKSIPLRTKTWIDSGNEHRDRRAGCGQRQQSAAARS